MPPDFTNWLAALKDLLCGGDKRTQSKDIRKAQEIAEALED
jgi:putative component of toxin-antitoxin plasmid stabilization module